METQSAGLPVNPSRAARPDLAHLLRLAQGDDRAAFRQIVAQCQARVFTIALRLTGQRADAEDLAQDVFVQLHAVLAQITDATHLERWLLRAIYHRSIDRLRQLKRERRNVPLEMLGEVPEGQAAESGADPIAAARLYQLLLQLQPDARAVMLLRYQDDLDPVDIAEVLEMPTNTVKSHLRRSLEWLRTQCAGEVHGY